MSDAILAINDRHRRRIEQLEAVNRQLLAAAEAGHARLQRVLKLDDATHRDYEVAAQMAIAIDVAKGVT